jgi:hypothetical protein
MTRDGNQRWKKKEETLGGEIEWIPSHSNIEEQMAVLEESPNAKLNPRWVETLMGLPVGWVMPSCQSPITPKGYASPSQGGSWSTPNTMDMMPPKSPQALARNLIKGGCRNLREDVVEGLREEALAIATQSFASPVTIEPTNSDSSETELCLPQQN